MQKYKTLALSVLKPYSALLFLESASAGFVLLLLTFLNPSVALSGVLAVVFTIAFAAFLEFDESYLAEGFYIYNSLLVGMGIGFIFSLSFLSVVLIAILSVFTFMFSFMLNRLFSTYKIPILSLPFSIITVFAYLASLKYSGLLSSLVNKASLYDITLPLVLSGFFKSFGTIFFLPSNLAGMALLVLVLVYSRILFVMALVGFYFGVLVHSYFLGSLQEALMDPYAFNYILVALALCGVFLLPTWKNFLLALIGVAISVVLTDAINILFHYYALPVFTLPFNLTVIVFIFILSMIYYKEFNTQIQSTPEESLSNYLSKIFRFGKNIPHLALPFSGEWSVYQAFDGEWTHKGKYKFAYDFVKKKEGKSYRNEGLFLQDYHAFGEVVLTPVSGYVVALRDDLVDNIIGEVDRINNWGNYIIIQSDYGFFVEISHLMQFSSSVKVGDYVEAHTIVAKCGNSGYSPEPHIHVQVQTSGQLGAFTREFCFGEYLQDNTLKFHSLPKNGSSVVSVVPEKSMQSRFTFILDDVFEYEVYEGDVKRGSEKFVVKMDTLGAFYFEDAMENKLYFYSDAWQFYFYRYKGGESYLQKLFIVAPRVPYIGNRSFDFEDYLPVYLLHSKFKQISIELLATLNKEAYKQKCTYHFDGKILTSKYGAVHLQSQQKGFEKIIFQSIQLRRKL